MYLVVSYIFFDLQQGWLSTILTISIFGSFNLISLGMVSEYLRISFIEIKKRPDYICSYKTYDNLQTKKEPKSIDDLKYRDEGGVIG